MHEYETRILFENLTPNPTRRVIVIGNSNMNRLSDDLKVCVNEDVQYIPYKLKLTSNIEEITSFIKSLELLKSDTVVFGGMSNFLLQGTIQERYAGVRPSGVPAEHEMEKQKGINIHHMIGVAPYDSSYFNKLGKHVINVVNVLNQVRVHVVVITPLPRYYQRCCEKATHFDRYFNFGDFNAEILRLGVYISRLPCLLSATCISPDDICRQGLWVTRGKGMLTPDQVHLTSEGRRLLRELTQRAIMYMQKPQPRPEIGNPKVDCMIPPGLSYSDWAQSYREICGDEPLCPTSSAKRRIAKVNDYKEMKIMKK